MRITDDKTGQIPVAVGTFDRNIIFRPSCIICYYFNDSIFKLHVRNISYFDYWTLFRTKLLIIQFILAKFNVCSKPRSCTSIIYIIFIWNRSNLCRLSNDNLIFSVKKSYLWKIWWNLWYYQNKIKIVQTCSVEICI